MTCLLHEKLNTPKRVIRSKELFLATAEKITADLGKPGVKILQKNHNQKRQKGNSDFQSV